MRLVKVLLILLLGAVLGVLAALVCGYVAIQLDRIPETRIWHVAKLGAEYRAEDPDRPRDFAGYLRLEEQLFAELRREVYDRIPESDRRLVDRYSAGSLADPLVRSGNGNASYELSATHPRVGVLLLHGLTDSPWSLRGLGERLHARGAHVVGLRLPGHGTVPAALRDATWQDWASAVRLAARHLREQVGPDVPLYAIGYSTGGALAVEYALARMQGEELPRLDGLVLISAAIGVDPLAKLAPWLMRLSRLPGLADLAWMDVRPEYDPHKYNSFPLNAGLQVYQLTQQIATRLDALAPAVPLVGFPRTLAFQSVADATVSAPAVVRAFLGRLSDEGHELVAFDINRNAEVEALLRPGARLPAEKLLAGDPLPFDVTLLTNAHEHSEALVALRRPAGTSEVRAEPSDLVWPRGIFSLSHVALPMPPDDPFYGAERPSDPSAIYLGRLGLLGENGLLAVPPDVLMRLRFNPFFDYLEQRSLRFLGLGAAPGASE